MSLIKVDLNKYRAIAHDKRRFARDEELNFWDIKATIPSEFAKAEEERQKIRVKYAEIQNQIDAAKTPEDIKLLLSLIQ